MRVISAVRNLWSALCAAASKLKHLYLENVPFATSLRYGPRLCGPCLLFPYSFSFMVVPTFLVVAYFMPFYRQFLIFSLKRIIRILRTLIQIWRPSRVWRSSDFGPTGDHPLYLLLCAMLLSFLFPQLESASVVPLGGANNKTNPQTNRQQILIMSSTSVDYEFTSSLEKNENVYWTKDRRYLYFNYLQSAYSNNSSSKIKFELISLANTDQFGVRICPLTLNRVATYVLQHFNQQYSTGEA